MTQEVSDTNPWSEGKAALNETAIETQFDDNFKQQQIGESNENGLQLPESEHYLAALGDAFISFLLYFITNTKLLQNESLCEFKINKAAKSL